MKSKQVGTLRQFGWALVMLFSLGLAGCGESTETPGRSGKPLLVTTIPPLKMILEPLAGPNFEVVSLTSGAFSPHTHELKPSDLRTVNRAVALVRVGAGFDAWARDIPNVRTLEAFDLLPEAEQRTYPEAGDDSGDHDHAHHDHDHEAGSPDPHFWTDPRTVAALTGPLADWLSQLAPEHAADFQSRASAMQRDLEALDNLARLELGPHAGRAVVLFHPSFHYLLQRHGIEVAAVIEPAPGREPTVMEMQRLAQACREHGVTVLFTEPQLAPDAAQSLAEMLKLPTVELDPLGGVEGRETYAGLIEYNVRMLAQGLAMDGEPGHE